MANNYEMSFFKKPITNKKPERTVTLFQVYQAIRSDYYKAVTEELRGLSDKGKLREFKSKNLDYVTPSGVFSYCSDDSLVRHSGLLCMDLDDLEDVEDVKQKLLNDKGFDTLLLFRSPRGCGLKWMIAIDLDKLDHRLWFTAVRNYLMATYGLTDKQVDKSCVNVSKACFLSYDPDVYIKTELIKYF